jgi:hypothetical protein
MPVEMHVSILKIILGTLIIMGGITVMCYILVGKNINQILGLIIVQAIIITLIMIWFIPEYDN